MLKEYSGDVRKMRVNGTLETFRLQSFMEAKIITDVSTGLTKLVNKINKFFPQCISVFRDDGHKIDYLTKPVTT